MNHMTLESVTLRDFRNVTGAELRFDPGFNLLGGDNGQGKSNLLEAVALLATGRSFRRTPPSLLRRNGCRLFYLEGRVRVMGLLHRLAFTGQAEGQQAWCNGKPLAAASALGETMAVVVIAPETLRLAKGVPADRRAFLDWVIFGNKRQHVHTMRDYQKALLSRNALLRRPGGEAELAAWEDRLADLGAHIVASRLETVAALHPPLQTMLAGLGLDGGRFQVRYGWQSCREEAPSHDTMADHYRRLLGQSREGDRRQGATSVGPHRDDLRLLMDGHPLTRYASQGQQRRLVFGLKLAEFRLLEQKRQFRPLLLLDDPMAELDRQGVDALLEILAGEAGQILLTSCRPEEISWPGVPGARLTVKEGQFGPACPISTCNRAHFPYE